VHTFAVDVEFWLDRGKTVVEICGPLDFYSAPRVREAFEEACASCPVRLAVVVSQVSFLDSSGIGVLIGAAKRARGRGGRTAVVGCSRQIARTLQTMGLEGTLNPFSSLDEAFAWLDDRRIGTLR